MTYTAMHPFGALVTASKPTDDVRGLHSNALRELFDRHHLLVLRGFAMFAEADEFPAWCERFGEISVWPFGKVLELVERNNPEDHIFDNNYVPLHWDGMYRPQVPELQIFHCVQAPRDGQGGRTTFSNTMLALAHASDTTKTLWREATGNYERKMEFYDSKTVSPIVTRHPQHGYEVVRYNEPPDYALGNFVNPPKLSFSGVEDVAELHRSLRAALYDERNFYAHAWQQGDIVIADNYSLLHGREAFVTKAPRHLRRVHVLGTPALANPALVAHQ